MSKAERLILLNQIEIMHALVSIAAQKGQGSTTYLLNMQCSKTAQFLADSRS